MYKRQLLPLLRKPPVGGVEVAPSTIPGAWRGLFATVPLKRGSVIADYTVDTKALSEEEFQVLLSSGRATHVALVRGKYLDASDGVSSIAGMLNRAPSGRKNNARINKLGYVVLTRPVKARREIFLAYGPSYRMPRA